MRLNERTAQLAATDKTKIDDIKSNNGFEIKCDNRIKQQQEVLSRGGNAKTKHFSEVPLSYQASLKAGSD